MREIDLQRSPRFKTLDSTQIFKNKGKFTNSLRDLKEFQQEHQRKGMDLPLPENGERALMFSD